MSIIFRKLKALNYLPSAINSSFLQYQFYSSESHTDANPQFAKPARQFNNRFSPAKEIIVKTSVILPTRASFYTGNPEYYETLYFLEDIYKNAAVANNIPPSEIEKMMNIQIPATSTKKKIRGRRAKTEQSPPFDSMESETRLDESDKSDYEKVMKGSIWKNQDEMTKILGFTMRINQYSSLLLKLSILDSLPSSPVLDHFLVGLKSNSKKPIKLSKDGLSAENKHLDEYDRVYSVGHRKTASAQVWLFPATLAKNEAPNNANEESSNSHDSSSARLPPGTVLVNGKPAPEYFVRVRDLLKIVSPFEVTDRFGKYNAWCRVHGGGPTGQSQAVAHGIAKALALQEAPLKYLLDEKGLLTRDTRAVERKKPGQKKARKKFTWVKR